MNLEQTKQDKDLLQEEQKFNLKTWYKVSKSRDQLSMDKISQIETSQKLKTLVAKISQVLISNLVSLVVPWVLISQRA